MGMANRTSQLFVHVGSPKTGTSSLQSALFTLNEALAQRSVFYPNLTGMGWGWPAKRGVMSGNAEMNVTRDPAVDEAAWKNLLDRCGEHPTGEAQIISSEMLAPLVGEEFFWRALADHAAARGQEAVVVVYLRDPFPFFLSTYAQVVKTEGHLKTFEDWTQGFRNYHGAVPLLQLDRVHELSERFGCPVRVLRFEDARGRIVEHFLETACGVPIDGLAIPDSTVNKSLTAFDCSFHRGVNSKSRWLGRLLAWERTDTRMGASHLSSGEPGRFELSREGEARLVELLDVCRSMLEHHTDFADRVDYSVDRRWLTERYTAEEVGTHLKFFELGQIIGNACTTGYIRWDIEKSRKPKANPAT